MVTDITRDEIACLVCGRATAPWFVVPGDWRRPDQPAEYPLRWCSACHFGQVHPRPERDEIPKFYDVAYYTHQEGGAGGGGAPLTLRERARIKLAWMNDHGSDLDGPWVRKHLGPQARVCDLGCGNGDLLQQLSTLGYEVVGVEPDADARAVARNRGLRVLPGTAEELPEGVEPRGYDCVIMSHVLEHTLRPKDAVATAARLLADGGFLVIETPNNDAAGLRKSGVLWPWLDVPRHLNFFTSRSLRAICEDAGLAVRAVEHCGYCRQFGPEWIGMERDIRAAFAGRPGTLPGPDRERASWGLLLSTARADADSKYDSVRILAGRP